MTELIEEDSIVPSLNKIIVMVALFIIMYLAFGYVLKGV
jgi:hypothetical protein